MDEEHSDVFKDLIKLRSFAAKNRKKTMKSKKVKKSVNKKITISKEKMVNLMSREVNCENKKKFRYPEQDSVNSESEKNDFYESKTILNEDEEFKKIEHEFLNILIDDNEEEKNFDFNLKIMNGIQIEEKCEQEKKINEIKKIIEKENENEGAFLKENVMFTETKLNENNIEKNCEVKFKNKECSNKKNKVKSIGREEEFNVIFSFLKKNVDEKNSG